MTGHRLRASVVCCVALLGTPLARAAGRDSLAGAWQPVAPATAWHPDAGGALPLTPAAQATADRNRAARRAGDTGFDGMGHCLPPGIPRLLAQPMPFRITLGRRIVAQLFQWNHLYRLVTLQAGHFPTIAPAYLGNAIGRWDGDTLVIDSNQFQPDTLLDDATPHSAALHVTERLSARGDRLRDVVTLDDPKTFTRPVTATLEFRRLPDSTILAEDYCLRRSGLLAGK